jgi:hypothetical protein
VKLSKKDIYFYTVKITLNAWYIEQLIPSIYSVYVIFCLQKYKSYGRLTINKPPNYNQGKKKKNVG